MPRISEASRKIQVTTLYTREQVRMLRKLSAHTTKIQSEHLREALDDYFIKMDKDLLPLGINIYSED